MKTDIVKVYESADPMKAEIANAILHKNGIRTMELNKKDSAMVFLGVVEIYTNAEDADVARELLIDAMQDRSGDEG